MEDGGWRMEDGFRSRDSEFDNPQSAIRNPQSTATLLTPRGRGAVATIRFEGDCRLIDHADPAIFRAANGKPLADQPINRVVFGKWGTRAPEDVVVCRTTAQLVEIHCHGGEAAAQRLLDDLQSIGCTIESWQASSTRSAGLFETECLEALTRATTLRTAEILLEQQSGVLRAALNEFISTDWSPTERKQFTRRLEELLRWKDFGLHLSRAWNVVLAGRPNVGKSSLINALVGYSRSIVYDQPGTTRDVVTAETALDGWPIQLADTAGIRADAASLETAGIELARNRLAEADCRVLLFDVSRPPHADDFQLLSDWPNAIRVAHKCDLEDTWGDELPTGAMWVSSVTGEGVSELAQKLVATVIPATPEPGTPIPITDRQIELLEEALQAVHANTEPAFRTALEHCMS